jgi:choline dehydrogenase
MVPELEEFRQALSKAWASKGEKLTENVYEGHVNGLVKCMNTIYKGVRSNSACFLDGRPNITIMAETRAKRVIVENKKASGALVIDEAGNEFEVRAKREVVLSTGVFEVSYCSASGRFTPAS